MARREGSWSNITLKSLLDQDSDPSTRKTAAKTFKVMEVANEKSDSVLPSVSWNSPSSVIIEKLEASSKTGVILINDIGINPPMVAIRETFCKLYENTDHLQLQLNRMNPIRGLFKNFGYLEPKKIDQKAVLDLSPTEIVLLQDEPLERCDLGPSFRTEVVQFYNKVADEIIPRLIYIASVAMTGGIGVGENFTNNGADHICSLHGHNNVKLRLVDFYPVHQTRKRCIEHRDFTTFTLIFQDKRRGGLEVYVDDEWVEVPAESEVIFLWGWSGHILSNARVRPPLHRVVPLKGDERSKADRRNEAVFYVAPDWDSFLHPIVLCPPKETLAFKISSVKELTVRKFKELFGLKWHQREGTLTEEERSLIATIESENKGSSLTTQDEDIIKFLRTGQSIFSVV